MKKLIESEIIKRININEKTPIYFKKNTGSNLRACEVVNLILSPYGYEGISLGQFERIAGGSVNCSCKIKNYETGKGVIANGFTFLSDIIYYCQEIIDNSVSIPLESVIEEFNWAKTAINKNYLTLYSNGKTRYDVEAMMDITKGLLNEVAFKIDCQRNGINVELNRDFYVGTSHTDEGQDIKRIKFSDSEFLTPKIKIQVKDVQYFMLVSKDEFYGPREAELFVGYKVHWKKANTGQRFFRSLGGRGEEIFSDFPTLDNIVAERRGWALRSDFDELKANQKFKGKSFNNNNMFVYWDNLRDIKILFPEFKNLVI